MKNLISFLLLCILFIPSLTIGEELYEQQINRGIRNSDSYSYLLFQQAKMNSVRANSILMEALRYSPDFPAAYFELSKARLNFRPESVFESLDYIVQGVEAYKRNFWWSFTLLSSVFTSIILSFILSIIIIVMIRLPKDMPLLSHDIREVTGRMILLLFLVFALFGPLFFLGGLLILISFYLRKWDRIVLYLYIIFLIVSPWIFNTLSMFFQAPDSGEFRAIVQVNESRGNRYALSVLRDKDNYVELFSYALALKREGRYSDAIRIYDRLIAKKPDPRTYNNLANCYAAAGDTEKAKELYMKSNAMKQTPYALYNLSQVSRETLDFDKGDEYFISAQRLDNNAVLRFRSIAGRSPNRFVVDERLPDSDLWEYSRKGIHTSAMGFSTVPPMSLPVIALLMAIIFFIATKRFKSSAYRCTRCGKILCNKCEKHILWGRMCSQCYRSLVKLDELDAKERIARLLTVYEYQKKRRDIIKVFSLIVPGSGQIYAGSVLYGLFLLWPFLFFLLIPITNSLFVIGMAGFSHVWLNVISIGLLVLIYIFSNMITRRRLSKGWL